MGVNLKALLATALAAVGLSAQAAGQSYTFDADVQGWSAVLGGSPVWTATGGNGGGYFQVADVSNDDFLIVFPSAAVGNWSGFLGGTLAFDGLNVNGDTADWPTFGQVTLSGSAGSLTVDLIPVGQPAADNQWHHYEVPLTLAAWGPTLPTVLGSLTSVTIGGEFHAGVSEIVGFDNISVTAVPEPAAPALMLAGLAALGLAVRRRRCR